MDVPTAAGGTMRHAAPVFLLALLHIAIASVPLGSKCTLVNTCSVQHSRCHGGICECQPYYVKYGDNVCLKSKLLGDECLLSEQCTMKVSNSSCVEEKCQCDDGYLQFRRHTCLAPAKPGEVCYSNQHCQLHAENSHCAYTIANLFGICHCNGSEKLLDINCQEYEDNGETTTETLEESTDSFDGSEDEDMIKETNAFMPPSLPTTQTNGETTTMEVTTETPSKLNEESLYNSAVRLTMQNRNQQLRGASPMQAKYRDESDYFLGNPTIMKRRPTLFDDEHDMRPIPLKRGGSLVSKLTAIEESDAVSLGLVCNATEQCRQADPYSVCKEGVCDCAIQNLTSTAPICNKSNIGCFPGTFQCKRSGVCLSWFFVCDGRRDCADGSDEECDGPVCPSLSYQCGNHGKCVSRSVVCDGKNNCPDGEDESDCSPTARNTTSCPEHSFRCSNGQCIPLYEFCNAIVTCEDGSDEPTERCREHKLPANAAYDEFCPFRCGNGRCRSTAIVCSGRDGCGDNSDEANCSVCRCPAP